MPELTKRLPANIAGAYYVDRSCTDCDLCRLNAPAFFSRDEETGYSFVHRQPVTPEEVELAEEALQDCPTESIGNDGAAPVQPAASARPA
jgi:ferredoxin